VVTLHMVSQLLESLTAIESEGIQCKQDTNDKIV